MLFDPSIHPTSHRAHPRRSSGGPRASAAVVPSLTPRRDRPAPSAALCPGEVSAKPPPPAFPGSAWPSPASSPFWVSASSPHSCAATPAPSNQSAASRRRPHHAVSPTATNSRQCAAISLCGASRSESGSIRSRRFPPDALFAQLRRAAQPVFSHVGFCPHRAPPRPTRFLLRV